MTCACHAPSVHKHSDGRRAQKLAKVKVADKLSFPLALDLAPLLAADEAPGAAPAAEQEYELAAILIHKGPSASHGHYGARGLCLLASPGALSLQSLRGA